MNNEERADRGIIMDNYYAKLNEPIPTCEYSEDGLPLSEIVKRMIVETRNHACYYKHQIYFDVEDIHEAVNKACIEIGLSDENFSPYFAEDNYTVNIYLYI